MVVKRSFKRILRPAIVFCGASVAKQWEIAVEEFTDLKAFTIVSVFDLRKFQELLKNDTIDDFDIVIVKNGTFVGKIDIPVKDVRLNTTSKYIITTVSIMSQIYNCAWSRVIYDDYDTIGLPPTSGMVPTLFTWIISGSRKCMHTIDGSFSGNGTIENALDRSNWAFGRTNDSMELWNCFNISCSKEYTEQCVNTGRPKFRLYEFDNPNDKCIEMIGLLGDMDMVEMLNGDAIATAAERAGLQCTSIFDMFRKILNGRHIEYRQAKELLAFIPQVRNLHPTLPSVPMSDDDPPAPLFRYVVKDLRSHVLPDYKFSSVPAMLDNETERVNEVVQTAGRSLERIKDNVKEGVCGICCADLDDDGCIIHTCGLIQCGICAAESLADGRACLKCSQELTNQNVVYLNKEFNIEAVVEEDFDYVEEGCEDQPDEIDVETEVEDHNIDPEAPPKIRTLLELIINGEATHPYQNKHVNIPNMLVGNKDLPQPQECDRRFIVFANFDETLENLKKFLTKHGIVWKIIWGSAGQIAETVRDFDDGRIKVLLLKTAKDCSGLNLQSATDLIFMHKIHDNNMEGQAVGRIQRFGRTCEARIHYLLYSNEVSSMSFV